MLCLKIKSRISTVDAYEILYSEEERNDYKQPGSGVYR